MKRRSRCLRILCSPSSTSWRLHEKGSPSRIALLSSIRTPFAYHIMGIIWGIILELPHGPRFGIGSSNLMLPWRTNSGLRKAPSSFPIHLPLWFSATQAHVLALPHVGASRTILPSNQAFSENLSVLSRVGREDCWRPCCASGGLSPSCRLDSHFGCTTQQF